MPPVSSPGLLERPSAPTGRPTGTSPLGVRRAAQSGDNLVRLRFRRAVTLMLLTLVLPGSAQIAVGDRRVGRIALRVVAGLIGLAVLVLLVGLVFDSFWIWLASNTTVLALVRFVLFALAIGWAYLFVDAWRLGDPLGLRRKQRLAMVGINGLLCFSVVGTLLLGAHVIGVQRGVIKSLFTASAVTGAHQGRFNVLLLGGDSGVTRTGLRPDSISVASIDAETGKTVLFGLPRNMLNFPFAKGSIMAKQFPRGYRCGNECELNSLVTYAADHRALFKGYDDPGVEATTEAVEGITGLKMNYYAMVNLAGFRQLVDAVGGVTLTVRDPIPKGALGDFDGKSYIQPGTRKLDGDDTLWFARSRMAADDYSRMARQKCVMNAMLQQLSPKQVVLNFSKIASAGAAMLRTDIPGSELDRFVKLALEARKEPVRTVSFVPPMIKTYDPDIAKIQGAVTSAIKTSEKGVPASGSTTTGSKTGATGARPPATGTTGGSYGNIHQGYTANATADLGSAC